MDKEAMSLKKVMRSFNTKKEKNEKKIDMYELDKR